MTSVTPISGRCKSFCLSQEWNLFLLERYQHGYCLWLGSNEITSYKSGSLYFRWRSCQVEYVIKLWSHTRSFEKRHCCLTNCRGSESPRKNYWATSFRCFGCVTPVSCWGFCFRDALCQKKFLNWEPIEMRKIVIKHTARDWLHLSIKLA